MVSECLNVCFFLHTVFINSVLNFHVSRSFWTRMDPSRGLHVRKVTQKQTTVHPCPKWVGNWRCRCSNSRRHTYFKRNGTFSKSRKAPINFISICPYVRMYQCGSYCTDFHEIWYWGLPWKSVEKIQVWLQSCKSIRHFTWRLKYALLLATILNLHHNALFKWDGVSLLG